MALACKLWACCCLVGRFFPFVTVEQCSTVALDVCVAFGFSSCFVLVSCVGRFFVMAVLTEQGSVAVGALASFCFSSLVDVVIGVVHRLYGCRWAVRIGCPVVLIFKSEFLYICAFLAWNMAVQLASHSCPTDNNEWGCSWGTYGLVWPGLVSPWEVNGKYGLTPL